jgi:hypothetical protein
MCIVSRMAQSAFGKPIVILGVMLAAFVGFQCCLPLATAIKIGADEDYELSKAVLCLKGHRLYTEVWNDQPPLHTFLVTMILKRFSSAVLGPRLLTTASTLLLLGSVFVLVLHTNGRLAAALASGLLIGSPGFLELSSSAMLEIPALAPAAAALCVLLVCPAGKWRVNVILGGMLFAVALQMKLIGIVYLPLAFLILVLRRLRLPTATKADNGGIRANSARATNGASIRSNPFALAIASDILICGAVIVLGFAYLNWLTGNPLGIQIQQAWASHFAPAQSLEYGSPTEHSFDWSVLPKNWDTSLPAVVGIVVLFRRARRRPSLAWLPLAWLGLTLAVFSTHRPWWAYYYIHNALPLCWCAAVGLAATFEWAWAARGHAPALILGVFALCALPWFGARLYLQESRIRHVPKLYNCRVLKEIERFKPFTQFMFADQPIYSFHSGIPVPPRLAILCLKRFWTGEMSNARIVTELEASRPGLMLLINDPGERCFQELLNSHYQLVYEDASSRLYALNSIARKAPY